MSVAGRFLDGLGPAFRDRAGPLLEGLVAALTFRSEVPDQMIRPADPNATTWVRWWPAAFDLDSTPDPAWLGNATGTQVPGGLSLEQQRDYIVQRPNWRRGTVGALRAAVTATLTGTRSVEITERDGSPWQLTIHTFAAETPDPAATLAAAISQKPVGIVLDYQAVAGASYQHFTDVHGPTFAADAAAFPTPYDMYTHLPE